MSQLHTVTLYVVTADDVDTSVVLESAQALAADLASDLGGEVDEDMISV